MEQTGLVDALDLTLVETDPANAIALAAAIPAFNCPSDPAMKLPVPGGLTTEKNNYRANAGSDYGEYVIPVERNNGIFLNYQGTPKNALSLGIALRDILDGSSNTALFSERAIGDNNNNRVTFNSDWYRIDTPNTANVAQVQADCNAAPLATGNQNQISASGRNWFWGSYVATRYNHVMTPNAKSCSRYDGTGNLDDQVNLLGGATTATSFHSGGVNLAMADGSVRFVRSSVSITVWMAVGGRNDGQSFTLD
jgi:prepilin-type processing-associated H-X9-DG protein